MKRPSSLAAAARVPPCLRPTAWGASTSRPSKTFCKRLIDRGTAALVPCGTTGEAPLLTAEEHHRGRGDDRRGGSRTRHR